MSPTVDNNQPLSCANCGKGEESAGDLKACTACNMVKYCNRDCQISHRPQHKKACKKRADELHDEEIFKQPPPNEDCPICMLCFYHHFIRGINIKYVAGKVFAVDVFMQLSNLQSRWLLF